jgi:hypothetical protein
MTDVSAFIYVTVKISDIWFLDHKIYSMHSLCAPSSRAVTLNHRDREALPVNSMFLLHSAHRGDSHRHTSRDLRHS